MFVLDQYLQLCQHILETGVDKEDRTGTGTRSVFGYQMRFNLQQGFPLLTTKRTHFKLIRSELLWFLKGDTNVKTLIADKNYIWNEWAFDKWIKSNEYDGPDMTDFGFRAAKDEAFATIYKEEMDRFNTRILEDEEFAQKYGD